MVGYFASPVTNARAVPKDLANLDYVRAILKDGLELFLYMGEEFFDEKTDESVKPAMRYQDGGGRFKIEGIGFEGTLQIELDWAPEDGSPAALDPRPKAAGPVPV